MPGMDGFEVVAALKQNPKWRDMPVIVLTAKDITEEDRGRLNGQVQQDLVEGPGSIGKPLLSELRRALAGQRTTAGR